MLHLVGLGLCDGKDITVRGRGIVEKAGEVFLEGYTSLLQCTHAELEQELGTSITILSREDVEQNIEPILARAKKEEIVILVIGDPFAATTHADLALRAGKVHVVHNASILSAVGEIGLELYRFGKTVSIPFWQKGYEPKSFLTGIKQNQELGLHTLCLLDIQTAEGKYMTVQEGIKYLGKGELPTLVIGVARLGCPDQEIVVGSPETVERGTFGRPPHCVIVPGKLHPIEEDMLKRYH